MKRVEAFALVTSHGGRPREGVTKDTRLLIVGELGWPLQDDGRPSNSLATARSYGIPIVPERRFLEWVGKSVPEAQTKTYKEAQLAALAKLPPDVVEQLSVFGLIEARDGHYGFRDLAAARQVAQLLGAGTPLSVITKSLRDIRKWLPGAGLANLRLFPESSDRVLVEQVAGRTDSKGQFVLDVAAPADDADQAFAQAQAAEEVGDLAAAEAQYRRVMKLDPGDPAAALNLGNLLRGQKRLTEAEAAYRFAVKADPRFAPAWHNLADLVDDAGRLDEAIACEQRALDADPDFADAVFNMALFLQRQERHSEAAPLWRRYLELDRDSPWAERAKRALKYCEIQMASVELAAGAPESTGANDA
jgi:tetratricopeptide (TPR) repeat protein